MACSILSGIMKALNLAFLKYWRASIPAIATAIAVWLLWFEMRDVSHRPDWKVVAIFAPVAGIIAGRIAYELFEMKLWRRD